MSQKETKSRRSCLWSTNFLGFKNTMWVISGVALKPFDHSDREKNPALCDTVFFQRKKMPGPAKCSVDGLYLFQYLHISWRLNSKSQYHNSQFPHRLIWEVSKILKAPSIPPAFHLNAGKYCINLPYHSFKHQLTVPRASFSWIPFNSFFWQKQAQRPLDTWALPVPLKVSVLSTSPCNYIVNLFFCHYVEIKHSEKQPSYYRSCINRWVLF